MWFSGKLSNYLLRFANQDLIKNGLHQLRATTTGRNVLCPAKKCHDKNGPLNWRRFFVSGGIVFVLFAGGYYYKRQKEFEMEKERRRSLGKASIGGSFELVDQDNKLRSNKDFLGQWCLIYFGFTHCPDVCPDELEKMVEVVDRVKKTANIPNVTPIFISVDPERDTPAAVKGYLKEFSDQIIGLTGNKEQVKKATRAYRVYYSAGPATDDNDYIVDHTIIMYLINPDGEFVDYYGQNKTAEQITNGVLMSMAKYRALKKGSWL